MRITQFLPSIPLLALVAACSSTDSEQVPVMSDSELEQYNAQAAAEDRIYCRDEVQLGSRLSRRVCSRAGDEEVRQQARLDWLGNFIE